MRIGGFLDSLCHKDLLNMNVKSDLIYEARNLFEEMSTRNDVSIVTLISMLQNQNGCYEPENRVPQTTARSMITLQLSTTEFRKFRHHFLTLFRIEIMPQSNPHVSNDSIPAPNHHKTHPPTKLLANQLVS